MALKTLSCIAIDRLSFRELFYFSDILYSLGQRKLRAQLDQTGETVLDQKQRPTPIPTFRWILQKFQAIHLVSMNTVQQVSNLSEERSKIIRLMGFPSCRYYLLN